MYKLLAILSLCFLCSFGTVRTTYAYSFSGNWDNPDFVDIGGGKFKNTVEHGRAFISIDDGSGGMITFYAISEHSYIVFDANEQVFYLFGMDNLCW